jgi:hypothetical protein
MNKPLALTLAAALFTAPGTDARSAAPTVRPGKPKPQTIARPLTRAQLQPTANVDASAVLADLLVRYADGKGVTRLEKVISKQLGKTPAKLEAARRLAARWRGASIAARSAVLGRSDLGNKPAMPTLQQAVASVSPQPYFALRPTIPLDPEKVPAPTNYSLKLSGIQTIAAHDGDGGDELATLAIFATPSGDGYTLTTKRSPKDELIPAPAAATTTVGSTLYDGGKQSVLVITALAEDEGGNASAALAEAEVMVELAAAVAQTLDGSDRLAVLQAMVDYTVGLQNLGADPQAAARSIASVRIESTDWFALWGVDSNTLDGVPWKLAVPHAIGGGQYELLLDVPSILPDMATVRVTVDKYWVESLEPMGYWKPLETMLTTRIKGAEHTIGLGRGVFAKNAVATYERKVIFGDVPLEFSAVLLLSPYPPDKDKTALWKPCDDADWEPIECGSSLEQFHLDLAPGSTSSRTATYSMRTNKLAGRGMGTNKLSSHGSDGRIGGINITVTD